MRYVHTNLIARDHRRLARFYQDVFGCAPLPPERKLSGPWLDRATGVNQAALSGTHLRLPGHGEGGPTLELFQYADTLERPSPVANRAGYGHLAFEVADVAEALDAVVSGGGERLGEIVTHEIDGAGRITFTYARDPEGNIVELQSWDRGDEEASREAASVAAGYARWADQYDSCANPTRDLDALVLRRLLPDLSGKRVVELGCGTGKNTAALTEANEVVALDLSAAMLERARAKVVADHVRFIQLDLTESLPFGGGTFDLAMIDLVLEHIEDVESVLGEVARVLRPGGAVLLLEFHPYRQLLGKGARFADHETGDDVRVPTFVHSTTEFVEAGLQAGLTLEHLGEWGDDGEPYAREPGALPRLLSLRLRRRSASTV